MDVLGLGKAVREWEAREGATALDLAEMAGVSVSAVEQVERGKSDVIAFGEAVRIAAVIGAHLALTVG